MREILLDNLVHVKIMESWTFYDLLRPEGQKYCRCLWPTLFMNTDRGHSRVSICVYHTLDTADPLRRQVPRFRTTDWKYCLRPAALPLGESANAEGWLYAPFYIIVWKTLWIQVSGRFLEPISYGCWGTTVYVCPPWDDLFYLNFRNTSLFKKINFLY